eukprot:6211093-Pleurochrysis_carterae.AAC.1
MSLLQPGALRCPPLVARCLALSPSRSSPAPCAVPPLAIWRLASSLTADVRLQAATTALCHAHYGCHGHVLKGRAR